MAKDPYRYFRIEAHELIEQLGRGLLQLEQGADPDLVRTLLRQAHTLKGASRVVRRGDIGDLAHKLEDELSGDDVHGRATVDAALAHLDGIRRLVATLDDPPQAAAPTPRAEAPASASAGTAESGDDRRTIRVEVRELDALLEQAFEARAAAGALRRDGDALAQLGARARDLLDESSPTRLRDALEELSDDIHQLRRALAERVDRLAGELEEVHHAASELRLVPAASLLDDLDRVARDAARELDKEVQLTHAGADTHIDAHVLARLRSALVHLIRNCVAHGIEPRTERLAAGKPPVGRIEVRFERRGDRVCVLCCDDGRGLDREALRRAAMERGLWRESEGDDALERVLLRGGVTTSQTVTGISGRGVGLEAVRHAVESLEGQVRLSSVPGKGTTVEMVVALSLSTLPALALHVDDAAVLIPLHSVKQTLRVPADDITRHARGESIVVGDQVVPYVSLRRALDRPARQRRAHESAVVVEADGQLAAIGVDRLGGARTIVVRAIPPHALPEPIVSGAAFDDDGVPQLVLSPAAMVATAARAEPVDEPSPEPLRPILVIDDSLTTRMLEQSILESAGYPVDLAVSAEQGLEMARKRRYGAFIVDVEMPGMSGFDFIARTRTDPELREVPAILVTSRADPDDLRRGREVGARAYIVKSEFDQKVLLDAIGGLSR